MQPYHSVVRAFSGHGAHEPSARRGRNQPFSLSKMLR